MRKILRSNKKLQSNSPLPYVSIIVPARNESATIGRVVRSAKAAFRRCEVIVIVNGSQDHTAYVARRAGARVIKFLYPLGHDVGRAIGAKMARGQILLFMDGDFVIPAAKLRAFIKPILRGQEIVLNRYSGYADARRIHSTSEAKRLLNKWLGRPDLLGSSLTSVPHAMTKSAAERIGFHQLAVPPKAYVKALQLGISATQGPFVPVAQWNRRRPIRQGYYNIERMILGDHVEAMHEWMLMRGARAGFTDLERKRDIIGTIPRAEIVPLSEGAAPRLSIVIVARNEQNTIQDVIWTAKQLTPEEIIVVVNGSTDRTAEIVRQQEVKMLEFPIALGHDVGRAVGALQAQGEIMLFLDGDIVFETHELWPFIVSCRSGADIALNDVNSFYSNIQMIDAVSMAKQFVNRIVCAPHLGYASMTAVPHAMTRHAIERIGYANLAVPPLAQTIAIVNGINVTLAPGVDVFQSNRKRLFNSPEHHNLVEQLILGDHAEALQWLFSHYGPRVFFPDFMRRREQS